MKHKNTATTVWQSIIEKLEDTITEESLLTWFKPLQFVGLDDRAITLKVPNQFHIDWIDGHYNKFFVSAIEDVVGNKLEIKYEIESDHNKKEKVIPEVNLPHFPAIEIESNGGVKSNLNDRFTFDNFVEGECNRFARAAAFSLAESPGQTPYNPLMLYGSSGLGKTHLIQAIGNYIVKNNLARKVMYVTSEQFTSNFIEALQSRKVDAFNRLYRGVDVLLLDDVQFFMAKDRTQEEFFHTFNTLKQAGKQLVFSSDRPPHELDGFDNRLINRLQWGLVSEVRAPEYETRLAIIRHISRSQNTNMPDDVAHFIATYMTDNIRSLEGALTHISAQASFMKLDISLHMARETLKNFMTRPVQTISVDIIQNIIAREMDVPKDLLLSKTRKKNIVDARHIAMYFTTEFTELTLKAIGLHFGGRDHGTVIHARNAVSNIIKENREKAAIIDQLRQKIKLSSV